MKMRILIGILFVALALGASAAMNRRQILDGADARIARHRTAEATLKLVGADGRPVASGQAVRIAQEKHTFLFGCNIFKFARCKSPQDEEAYRKHYSDLLNFATLPFYWWVYEQERGRPMDAHTARIVEWCKAHNITTKGHPLAWNYVDPPWLSHDPSGVMDLQMARIERCVRRFAGDIDIWDVVNEATHYDRPGPKEKAPMLTKAIAGIGVSAYLRKAFATARAGNPDATLLINDYRTDQAYVDKVLNVLVDAEDRARYDVIGIQSHMHGGCWSPERIWAVCDKYAGFGKPLHFTETTIVSGLKTKQGWHTTSEGERKQAEQAAQFYTVLFSHPAVEAITWWDFSDQGAWQQAPAGFLRKDMSPKPVYHALKSLIRDKWWTRLDASVQDGTAGFRGFFGDYRVRATIDGRKVSGRFRLVRGATGPIEVRLT
jgi:endo-1,4-beta-xylanase